MVTINTIRHNSQCNRVAAPIAMETMSLFLAIEAKLLSRTFELPIEVFLLIISTARCHVHTQAKYSAMPFIQNYHLRNAQNLRIN